ncbi:uncharacterized protein LOC130673531 [Microplitis mediator]|uniref:uncharacterized protein LOC130673531 n=1 Tax=Microplitis mediator TaxID=375433 RepID=UPI0025579ACA|nr:uncharacterized protein LOC130673531 [Microplitis mediator]
MYPTDNHFVRFSTWYQFVLHTEGLRRLLGVGVVVGSLASFISPHNALDVINFVAFLCSGHLPPELVQAREYFEGVLPSTAPFEVVLAPNHEEIEMIYVCLLKMSESMTRAEAARRT